MNQDYYLKLRNQFQPRKIKVIFVLESPPASGKYFYDCSGELTEPLFHQMMQCLFNRRFQSKKEGLSEFMKSGYFLVDATYTPVNKMNNNERNDQIIKDYGKLLKDLDSLDKRQRKKIKIVLVKANVCRLLEPRLLADKYNVINNGIIIPFPANGNQNKFCRLIKKIFWRFNIK